MEGHTDILTDHNCIVMKFILATEITGYLLVCNALILRRKFKTHSPQGLLLFIDEETQFSDAI